MKVKKQKRGLALVSPEKRKEIASLGGIAAHKFGTAHEFDSKTGSAAGKKGGKGMHKK